MRKGTLAFGAILSASVLAWAVNCAAGETVAAAAAKVASRPAGVPAGASVWVVTPSLKTTVERLKKLVDSFQPGAGPMVEMVVKQGSPWSFEEADETKPLIAICQLPQDPGAKPQWAAVGSLKAGADGAAALEQRFGGKPEKVEDGLSVFLQVQGGALPDKEMYAVAKDGRVTLGDSKDLVKMLSACPAPAEGAYPAGVDLIGGVDVKVLAAQYKNEIDEGLKKLEAFDGQGMPPGMAMTDEAVKQFAIMAKALAGVGRKALVEVDTLGCDISLGDVLSIGWRARAVAGGEFAGWLGRMEKLQLPSAGLLPESGMASMVMAFEPESLAAMVNNLMAMSYGHLAATEEGKKALDDMIAQIETAVKTFDGTVAMSATKRAGGLSIVSASGLKDHAAAREATLKNFKLMESGPFADELAKAGAKYTFSEKVRESNGLAVDRLTIDVKLPADPNVPVEVQDMGKKMMEKMLGLPMLEDFAFGKGRCVVAAGKETGPALDELLARVLGAQPATQAMAATLKAAPKGSFVAGEMYFLQYVSLMMEMVAEAGGGMMPIPKLNLPKEAEQTPWTAYVSSSGGELGAELRIPVEPIRKMVEAFKKMQQDMMQNMQNQPAVPLPVE